ncbi:MAG TPA: SDR family oxidoreductase [Chthoniobacterales bacterium]
MPESVAVVTGASQGIGRATALRLAKDFSGLVLAARNVEALKKVAAEVKSRGAEPLAFAEAPKSAYAAVATINAAIVAMARAFAERGIGDGVQVNSVLPGPVLTNRRRTYMEKYAPAHDMTFEEAMNSFPAQAGISRYGQPEEIADHMPFLVSPHAKWMTGSAVRRQVQSFLGRLARGGVHPPATG